MSLELKRRSSPALLERREKGGCCQEARGFVKFRVESVEFRVSLQFTV